ncbi:MerR family transcriptional regulator [Heliophilum fasciatum]|uniref:B12 binding protein n=1 Tax=Heliophilum fasciatum TaxID=35700 RepID=A0A4R2RFU9_9FIRM|nr:MerR family transcriptional regulator [Heliophilum fasciatum]MCW2278955.1 DNA-binding transcriptional MerR regulator [Heliophilum fasciatum]TCP61793.1 B12 binding protein [Heliophilum fasciatum]
MSTENQGVYNIKAVEKMTGVAAGTLRVWEHRYQVIQPARNRAGYRVYSQDDVQTIQWLAQQVKNGVTISQAVKMLQQEVLPPQRALLDMGMSTMSNLQGRMQSAIMAYDEKGAGAVIEEALSFFSVERVAMELIVPVMAQVQQQIDEATMTLAHAHFAANFFRTRLAAMLGALPTNQHRPLALVASLPGDQHELCLLILSIYLRRRGFRTIYLGNNLPVQELARAMQELQPRIVGVCVGERALAPTVPQVAEELSRSVDLAAMNIHIGFGGLGLMDDRETQETLGERYIGMDLEHWDDWLEQLG